MLPPTPRAERLTLRPIAPEDLDALAEIVAAPGVRKWWGELGGEQSLRGDRTRRRRLRDRDPRADRGARLRQVERAPNGRWRDGLPTDLLATDLREQEAQQRADFRARPPPQLFLMSEWPT